MSEVWFCMDPLSLLTRVSADLCTVHSPRPFELASGELGGACQNALALCFFTLVPLCEERLACQLAVG